MFEHLFKRVQKGSRPNSDEYNMLVSTVEALSHNDRPGGNFFGGKYDINPPEHSILRGVLLENLDLSESPLSAPKTASMLVLKPKGSASISVPTVLGTAVRHIKFTNRSVDMTGAPGTFMKVEWTGEEWSVYWIDCGPSAEGLQLIADYEASTGWSSYNYTDTPATSRRCGGGSSCTRVRFQVIVSDALTRTALCAIVSRPYGCGEGDIPGTVIDGAAVEICDPAGCFFNDPNDLLQGREGWAEYMMPVAGTTFCQDGSYYLVPEWQVYSLCCSTDTCNL